MTDIEQAKRDLGDEFSFFSDLITAQLQRMKLGKDARILDVGTGMGRVAVTLALHGHRVLTGEPAEDHSEYAKQPWQEAAAKVGVSEAITYEPFAAEKMPFDDESFDGVFVLGALHHMNDAAAAVAECVRVLASGGVLCIMEPNAAMIEIVHTRHPTHPEPTDPRPFLQGMAVEVIREEKFDVYLVRRREQAI